MRFIWGMIVGAALLLGSAYLHDTGVIKAGPPQAFVNWTRWWGCWEGETVVPAKAGTHTPCAIVPLRRMGPGPRKCSAGTTAS